MSKRVGERMIHGLWLALLLSGCAGSSPTQPANAAKPATEQPVPTDLRGSVAQSCTLGRQLYVLDKVAAIGTDVLFEHVQNLQDQRLAGYLPMQEGDSDGQPSKSFLVSFFDRSTPPRIAYEIRIAPGAAPGFQAFSPPKEATPGFATLARARQVAIDSLPNADQPMNPVLIPGEALGESGVLVYLLAGTKRPNIAVFGRHFRALVPLGGSAVTYIKPLTNSVLEVPTRGPNGEVAEALTVTHLVTDFPLETHVFTSLLMRLPIYVATKRGLWLVDGDKIAFLGEKAPNEAS